MPFLPQASQFFLAWDRHQCTIYTGLHTQWPSAGSILFLCHRDDTACFLYFCIAALFCEDVFHACSQTAVITLMWFCFVSSVCCWIALMCLVGWRRGHLACKLLVLGVNLLRINGTVEATMNTKIKGASDAWKMTVILVFMCLHMHFDALLASSKKCCNNLKG